MAASAFCTEGGGEAGVVNDVADYQAVIAAPFGRLGVCVVDGAVQAIDFLPEPGPVMAASTALAAEAVRQLRAYLADPRHRFDLPLAAQGTAYQRRVWAALAAIPAGETRTYGELACALGSSARAVGGACRANPVPVLVPCHRVVARNGVGGFSGHTDGPELARKCWLLAHEGAMPVRA